MNMDAANKTPVVPRKRNVKARAAMSFTVSERLSGSSGALTGAMLPDGSGIFESARDPRAL